MDRHAASLANSLLGNKVEAAVMEITMTGPTLKFHCDAVICISGADMSPSLNGSPITINSVEQIKRNDILSFGKLSYGFRCYLAVSGGFNTEEIMHSFSMYNGITSQFKLNKSNLLPISETSVFNTKHASIRVDDSYFHTDVIKAFKGPEFDQLSKQQKELLFSTEFTISKDNSRMAYQLEQTFRKQSGIHFNIISASGNRSVNTCWKPYYFDAGLPNHRRLSKGITAKGNFNRCFGSKVYR